MTGFDAAVGERASHVRKALSISLSDAAEAIGVTRQTMSRYESGKSPMTAVAVRTLCELYQVPPSWLLGEVDELDVLVSRDGRAMHVHEVSPSMCSPLGS